MLFELVKPRLGRVPIGPTNGSPVTWGGLPIIHVSLGLYVLLTSFMLLTQPVLAQEARAQRGLMFVQTNCATCHAIRRTNDSPLPIAPPLRDLHKRYPVADLAESFAEGIVTRHPTMPQFQLDAAQIGDLIAYLETLEH